MEIRLDLSRRWAVLLKRVARFFGSPPESRTPLLGADEPIRSVKDDLLQRGKLANRIADILESSYGATGRVFAVRADWGVGKSSIKNLVIESLQERDSQAKWLEFNPWQWGDYQAISRALFHEIASKLGKAEYSTEGIQRARQMRRYADALLGAGSVAKSGIEAHKTGIVSVLGLLAAGGLFGLQAPVWLPNLGLDATELVTWALALIAFGALAARVLKFAFTDRSSEPLDALRLDLEKRLKRLRAPLIIFVDDMDRLEPDLIRLMIRQVKANANLPNIVFVLLFHPRVIERALDAISEGEGAEYLEKIVHASFDLPVPSKETLIKAFTAELEALVGPLAVEANGFQQVRWGNVLLGQIRPFLGTLRDTRRLLTSVAIHTPLHQGTKVFEVNLIDFLALEALRVFEPPVYNALTANKALLLQSSRFDGDNAKDTNKAAVETILGLSSENHRETVQEILIELFPRISGLLTLNNYGDDWFRTWAAEKRVCVDRMFDRYFELQIPQGMLSESDWHTFLENCSEPKAVTDMLGALKSADLLPSLAGRLDEGVDQLPLEHIDVILPALFDVGREMLTTSSDAWNMDYVHAWRAASWMLKRIPEAEKRSEAVAKAMAISDARAVPAVLISLDLDAREKKQAKEFLFDEAGFERLRLQWVEKVRATPLSDLLESEERLLSILYRWADFAGDFAEPKAALDSITKTDADFVKVLGQFVSITTVQGWGDRVSRKVDAYQRKPLEDFFGLEALRQRVDKLKLSDWQPDDRTRIQLLMKHLDAWQKGEDPDDDED